MFASHYSMRNRDENLSVRIQIMQPDPDVEAEMRK